MARHLHKPRPGTRLRVAAAASVLALFGSYAAVAQTPQSDRDLLISIHQQLHAAGIPDTPTSSTSSTTSTSTTAPTTSTSTSTTAPTATSSTSTTATTSTTIPAGTSYVNPVNTGAEGTLGTYSGPLTITTSQTIQNVVVRGEVRVCGNITVTFRNVRWEPVSTNAGGRAFQVDGSNGGGCTNTSPTLILDHVTIAGGGRTQRGVSAQRGGVAQVHFADISGVEDCMNTLGGTTAKPNILADSYCHDQVSPASGAHYDGYQIMGGRAEIRRNVFEVRLGATAAVFPKSEGSSVNVLVDHNWASGGTYTIRFGDGINNTTTGTYTDNEVLEDSYMYGAYLSPQYGATATTARNVEVTWDIGEPGFHPGNQS